MPNFNNCTLAGHLVRDPELRYVGTNATALTTITLAINSYAGKDKEPEVLFIDCTIWSKAAEAICEYAKKGDALLVSGRIKQDSWDDKNTGEKRYKIGVVVERFEFLKSKGGNYNNVDTSKPTTNNKTKTTSPAQPNPEKDESFNLTEEIPF